MRVLVTGGAGYIGAHTVAELTFAGHEVTITDSLARSDKTLLDGLAKLTGRSQNFHQGDCSDQEFLARLFSSQGPFDCVLHFAAYKSVGESVEKPLLYYENNLGSLLSLLSSMKNHGCTGLIFSSSCTVYGQPDRIPVDEQAPFKHAESPYGSTKQMCERILKDATATGLKVISLRYFNPIGAHPSALLGELPIGPPNNLVPYITQAAAGIREAVTVFGDDYNTPDGTCIRDFIHVVDIASAHVRAMDYLNAQKKTNFIDAFNLGTGTGVSVMEIITQFIETTGIQLQYVIGKRRPGDVEKVFADPSRANKLLGWEARFSLKESLMHAWQWEKRIRNIS